MAIAKKVGYSNHKDAIEDYKTYFFIFERIMNGSDTILANTIANLRVEDLEPT